MMKRILLLAVGSLLSLTAFAKAPIVEKEFYVFDSSKEHLKKIQAIEALTVDHVSSRGYEVYGPNGTEEFLNNLNAKYLRVNAFRYSKALDDRASTGYPDFEDYTQILKDYAHQYPEITKLYSVGKSNEGRELWVLKISDNAAVDEKEPEFKYISTMHGDEVTGREMLYWMIGDILKNYGKDKRITDLVNNTELFIMPSMNPDGTTRRRRGNAKNQDLNRSFPDFTTPDNSNNPAGRPVETQAIMQWQKARHFALSANFHGGAEVINYPWDTARERHPLDGLVHDLSVEYAAPISSMANSSEFHQGVTNGYDWYTINGSMQDWSYYWHGDLQITVEVSNQKWPSFTAAQNYYKEHGESLIRFAERVHQGAGFYLEQAGLSGRVAVYEISKQLNSYRKGIKNLAWRTADNSLGRFGFDDSEFYKVLPEGEYLFDIELNDGTKKSLHLQVNDPLRGVPENGNVKKVIL